MVDEQDDAEIEVEADLTALVHPPIDGGDGPKTTPPEAAGIPTFATIHSASVC